MSELEDRLRRFAHEWHEAMNSPYAVDMMPMLLEAASDVRRLVLCNEHPRELLQEVDFDHQRPERILRVGQEKGERMSITDELREYVDGREGMGVSPLMRRTFTAIADRIDAEHEHKVQQAHADGLNEQMDFHDNFVPSNYVLLPVDADGVPIRVGDVMEERSGHTFEVASLMAFGGSDNWLVLSDARNFSSFREPHDLRHYHAPTVEDVLTEFGIDWEHESDCEDRAALLKEYAKRLTLAEGEDA